MPTGDTAQPPRDRIYSTRTLVLVVILLTACVILPLLLSIRQLSDLDAQLFLEVREQYETGLKSFLRAFTELGSLPVWFLMVPILWLVRKKKEAAALLISLLMVVLFAAAIKYAIDRPRPYEIMQAIDPLYRPTDPSFPSAHAMTIFAATIAVGMKWRKALIPLLILAAAIGFSRVYIGVHYPYDVASGALIGILIGLVADSLDLNRTIRWTEIRIGRIAGWFGLSRDPR